MKLKLARMWDHNGTNMEAIAFMYHDYKALIALDEAQEMTGEFILPNTLQQFVAILCAAHVARGLVVLSSSAQIFRAHTWPNFINITHLTTGTCSVFLCLCALLPAVRGMLCVRRCSIEADWAVACAVQ